MENLAEYGIQNLLSLILSGLLKRVNFVFQILVPVFNFQQWKTSTGTEKQQPRSSSRKVLKKHIKQLTHKGNFVFCSKDNDNMVAGAVHILTIPWKTKDKSINSNAKGYWLIALMLQIKWMSPLVKYFLQTLIGYSRVNMYTVSEVECISSFLIDSSFI